MVTDKQVKDLVRFLLDDRSIARAARLTDMDEKTARKYRDLGKLVLMRIPDHVSHPGQRRNLFRRPLRVASRNHNLCCWILPPYPAQSRNPAA